MSRSDSESWPAVLVVAGVAGGVGLAAWLLSRASGSIVASSEVAPGVPTPTGPFLNIPPERPYTVLDVEAAARMLASENPRRSERLHIEQIWTQLRSRTKGQTLFDRITAGSGWGPQGERKKPNGVRPVSTEEPATERFRELARHVLDGKKTSRLPGAKKFFEPAQVDAAFKIASEARSKLAAGKEITKRERRLLGYRKTSAMVREDWLRTSRYLDTIDGVEFYT